MTSAVSAADVIIPLPQQQISQTQHHGTHKTQGEPPPECPMHKPAPDISPPMYSSECPISDMAQEDINPLNMVCMSTNSDNNNSNNILTR